MADIEKTALLTFEVDQQAAERDLVQTEKNIIAVKKQQAELNKEYKAGKVTEDEYVKSNIKLQQSLKKEVDQKNALNRTLATESNSRNAMRQRVSDLTKEYNNLNTKTEVGAKRSKELVAELSKLNSKLNEGSKAAGSFKDNIGNYPEKLSSAVNEVKPFGASIDGVTGSMSKFISPAGAVLGLVAGLGAAYAKSSSGAKDLAFAQDLLTSATESVTESIGNFLSGGQSGDGGGFLSTVIGGLLFQLSPELATTAILATQAKEALRKLEIEATRSQGFAKFYEQAAENARRLRDDEEKLLEDRLKSSNAVENNLLANQTVRLNVINQEIEAIKTANANWKNQDAIVLQIEQKRAQTRDIEEEINGKLTENLTARKAIQEQIKGLAQADRRAANQPEVTTEADPLQGAFATQLDNDLKLQENFNDRIGKMQKEAANEAIRQKQREAVAKAALNKIIAEQQLETLSAVSGAAMALLDEESDEYKAFATFQTLISTYSTAQKAYEAGYVPPTAASPFLAAANVALAIAQGAANVAAINGVEFAEGGFTGKGGKFEPAGIVHKGEYVAPQHIVNSPMAQPHINALEGMRVRGYADGGFVTNQNTAQAQQSLLMLNAIKNLPPGVIGVEEVTRVQRRIATREKVARI